MILTLLDTGNLYYCCGKRFPGRKIDYSKYLDSIPGLKSDTIAYVAQVNDEANGFVKYLQDLGVIVKTAKPKRRRVKNDYIYTTNWAPQMVADALMASCTEIVIGSSNSDLMPLVELKHRPIHIFASGIPKIMKDTATSSKEITEEFLK